jgi:acetate kinase
MSTPRLILAVNAGSSSLKLATYCADDGLRQVAGWNGPDDEEGEQALQALGAPGAGAIAIVAHRVVHGGERSQPAWLDRAVVSEIEQLAAFAPLHNPAALRWIRRCAERLGAPQLAVFDTAFFAAMPETARSYALPLALSQSGLRRYGFHGLAHRSMWEQWSARSGTPRGRVISLQLGAGCSIAAVHDGRGVDISMGFSPLEGLVMATRCGDIDAGLVLHLLRDRGCTVHDVERMLNGESGLLGVSGFSGDMRELLASGDAEAQLAVELFCYRARKYVGAYLAVLGGADAILFGGGIGENAPQVRERMLEGLAWAGIAIDRDRNAAAAGPGTPVLIGGPKADGLSTAVWVIPVDEAQVLAQEGRRALEGKGTEHA